MNCKHANTEAMPGPGVCKACQRRLDQIDNRAEWGAKNDTHWEIRESKRLEGQLISAGRRKASIFGNRG